MRALPHPRRLSLSGELFLLQIVAVLVAVTVAIVFAYQTEKRANEEEWERQTLTTASSIAHRQQLSNAMMGPNPTPTLEPTVEYMRNVVGAEFISVVNTQGIQVAHSNPAQIGRAVDEDLTPALHGQTMQDRVVGRMPGDCRAERQCSDALGLRIRATVPIFGNNGQVVGAVRVSTTHDQIVLGFHRELPGLLGVIGIALGVTTLGAFLASRRVKRQTLGLEPAEITSMYEHDDAVLHAVREGLLVVDPLGRLVLANDEAMRLVALEPSVVGQMVSEISFPDSLRELLTSGHAAKDEVHLTRDRILLVNQMPVSRNGRVLGTATTLRDHTELRTLMGELDSVRGFAEALRSQAHEAANRLHTVVMLIELGKPEQAVRLATAELQVAQQLADQLCGAVEEPTLAALLLGKVAAAHEKGVELLVTPDTVVHSVDVEMRDLVTLVGNLVDNAIDAAIDGSTPKRVMFTARQDSDTLLLRVADSGQGVDPEHTQEVFTRGWSTKPTNRLHGRGLGLSLVGQVVNKYAGTIDVANNGGAVFTVRLPVGFCLVLRRGRCVLGAIRAVRRAGSVPRSLIVQRVGRQRAARMFQFLVLTCCFVDQGSVMRRSRACRPPGTSALHTSFPPADQRSLGWSPQQRKGAA